MLTLDHINYSDPNFSLTANLKVSAGEVAAVLGPSGAGKSTLLNLIAGFAPCASGKIIVNRAEITKLLPSQRPVSLMFQDNNVFPHLTLEQNVALGVSANLRLSDQQHVAVKAALARVGLSTLANRKPADVSGGERQRVALARVLVRNKEVLLLDEPFAALDPGLRRNMLALVAEITAEYKLATLLVSHQPLEVSERTKMAIFVSRGIVHTPVFMAEFLANRTDPDIASYLGI